MMLLLSTTLTALVSLVPRLRAEAVPDALMAQSRTQYVHSNDTLAIKLADDQTTLFGRIGDRVTLRFEVINRGTAGQFYLTQQSEDNFEGGLEPSDSFFLDRGGVKVVTVHDMLVPRKLEGSKVVFALTVTRATGRSRRQIRPPGGSGSFDGVQDPTRRREATVTIWFTVTDEPIEDDSAPSAWVSYYGQGPEETCQSSPDDEVRCWNEYWWTRVMMEDDESGLRGVELRPILGEAVQDQRVREGLFYRHMSFPVGTDNEQEVSVGGNCCLKGLEFIAKDVAGNTRKMELWNGDEGFQFVGSWIFWLLIALVVVVLIGAVVGGIFLVKKKYSAVPSNA